jgi:hypothetical protein
MRGRRRLRDLEVEVAEARAEGAELRQRIELFESMAAAAGATIGPVPLAPMPPELVAAARELPRDDVPMRLDVAGVEVIAVVGGPGDPREWWTAIWELAGHERDAS